MNSCTKKIKKWVENDMKNGNHVYTEFKDIDGIPLAERMVLVGAWHGSERRKYYVKRDIKKNKYYLQSFMENITHFSEYCKKEYYKVKSRGKGIEIAAVDFMVEYDDKCVPSFLEDYGYHDGEFPCRIFIVNGECHFEDVKE